MDVLRRRSIPVRRRVLRWEERIALASVVAADCDCDDANDAAPPAPSVVAALASAASMAIAGS